MSANNFADVGAFHRRFNLPRVDETHSPGPRPWDDALLEFRTRFLHEELKEFEDGVATHDHAKMADSLIDLTYVAMGSAHVLGYPWPPLWNEVQAANLRKVRAAKDGSDSARGSGFDVVKPYGWYGPDIHGVLKRYGFTR